MEQKKQMIVDVITNRVMRVTPVLDGPNDGTFTIAHETIPIYEPPNPNLFVEYADADLCDIRAFGLSSGFVRVVGGVSSLLNGLIPVPAAPRVYNFFVNTPVLKLAFPPDGTSLAILYQSCLVVVSIIHPQTFHVFYFGQNHTDVFTTLKMTDDYVYVYTTTDEVLRFSIHEPHELVRMPGRAERVHALIPDTNEWVVYQDERHMIVFEGVNPDDASRHVPLTPAVSAVRKIIPTPDKNYVWCLTDSELLVVSRSDIRFASLPVQYPLPDTIKVLSYNVGLVLGWFDEQARKIHLKSFDYMSGLGEIVQTSSATSELQTDFRALALPASPFTRFTSHHPVMFMHKIRRTDVVFNHHLFPDPDADDESSESDTEDDADDEEEDDEEEDDEDDEEDDDEVVHATFNYPQPPSALQQLIRRTRDYLPTLSETFVPWTPAEFERVVTAASKMHKRIHKLHQQAAMLLHARENHKVLAQAVTDTVRHFSDFYGGSASMGLLEMGPDDLFAPYASIQARADDPMDENEAERILAARFKFSETSVCDPLGFESQEFKVDMAYQLGTHFRGIEADTIHAVNTGVISTMNCYLTEVNDLVASISLQRKLMKIVARTYATNLFGGEETSESGHKRTFTTDAVHRSKRSA